MAQRIQQRSYGGPEVLELVDVPEPDPRDLAEGEVLVRVRAAGVNPVDTQTRRGGGVSGLMGGFPFTVGWDVAGTVAALGPGAGGGSNGLAVGSRVFAFSRFPEQAAAYADFAVLRESELALVPPSMSDAQAGGLPLAGLTAWQDLVDIAAVQPGQRVLIHGGGGGVGHLAVQIAHDLGAYVIATASAGKCDWVASLGADEVLDYTRVDVVAGLRNRPVDVVLDTVSGPMGPPSVACAAPGGTVIELLGVSEETKAAAQESGVNAVYHAVHPDGGQLQHLADMVAGGRLAVDVSEEYPLARAADAHRAVESGRTRGKLVLRP